MANNIFEFATSELSQDAVICWCINWLNYSDSSLHQLAVDFIKLIYPDFDESIDDEVVILRQFYKTDILAYLKRTGIAIIIEDKVYTSEHDDQIERYKNAISTLSESELREIGIGRVDQDTIYTVYLKTGEYYDDDKMVAVDCCIQREHILALLDKYKNDNLILSYYYEYLQGINEWYVTNGDVGNIIGENHWEWNVSKNQIAQYNLMRYIFPEEEYWKDKAYYYKVYHGSSFGRPWTEMVIYDDDYDDGRCWCIFWRIDSDTNGPYISLRLYDGKMDKNKEEHRKMHEEIYEHLRGIAQKLTQDDTCLNWDSVKYRYTGSSKESTIIRIGLTEYLKSWDASKYMLSETVTRFNKNFLICLEKENVK